MSATTRIACDGPKCPRAEEVPVGDVPTNARLYGWITRFFQDRVWLPNGEQSTTSAIHHYCPECARKLTPAAAFALTSASYVAPLPTLS